jgi:hypothetical protein
VVGKTVRKTHPLRIGCGAFGLRYSINDKHLLRMLGTICIGKFLVTELFSGPHVPPSRQSSPISEARSTGGETLEHTNGKEHRLL